MNMRGLNEMNVVNIKILYTGENDVDADVMMIQLCAQHVLAGAHDYSASSCLWVGGQLTNKKAIVIDGVTKPEYIDKIIDYLEDKEAVISSIIINDVTNERFLKWFTSHL